MVGREGPRAWPHCSGGFLLPSTAPGGPGTTFRVSAWASLLWTRPGRQDRCLCPSRPQPWPPYPYSGRARPCPGCGSLQVGNSEVLGYTCPDLAAHRAPRRLDRTMSSVKQKPLLEQTPTEPLACAFPSGSVACPGGVRPRQGARPLGVGEVHRGTWPCCQTHDGDVAWTSSAPLLCPPL